MLSNCEWPGITQVPFVVLTKLSNLLTKIQNSTSYVDYFIITPSHGNHNYSNVQRNNIYRTIDLHTGKIHGNCLTKNVFFLK